jgi:glucokinase
VARYGQFLQEFVHRSGVTEIPAAGVALAGWLDARGRIAIAPNFSRRWIGFPLLRELRRAVPARWTWALDMWAAVLAVQASRKKAPLNFALVTCGTGIGAGLILNGQLHTGYQDMAGNIGHGQIDSRFTKPFGIPPVTCLESIASGPAMLDRARKGLRSRRRSGWCPLFRKLRSLEDLDLPLLARAARAGDALARMIWTDAGIEIGRAVGLSAAVLGLEEVIFGGGIMRAHDLLLPPIRSQLADRVHPPHLRNLKLSLTNLGPDAGCIGAALRAKELAKR